MKDQPAFPHSFKNATMIESRLFDGMSLLQWYAGMALGALAKEGIISSAIPSLAKATGRDEEWRREMIGATAKSCVDLAEAILVEIEMRTTKE